MIGRPSVDGAAPGRRKVQYAVAWFDGDVYVTEWPVRGAVLELGPYSTLGDAEEAMLAWAQQQQ